jgi:very-short-patch-repair endonuclease
MATSFADNIRLVRTSLYFYCPALKLALESDGRHHEAIWRTQYEGARTEYLRRRGITIVRIRNEDFIRDSFMVEEVILAAIRERE